MGDVGKDIIEIEEERLSEREREERSGEIEIFYIKYFKKILALKEYEWLRSMGIRDWSKDPIEHAIWHQGALHCLQEMRDWFESQVNLSKSRFQKEEEPEPGEVIPPIDE